MPTGSTSNYDDLSNAASGLGDRLSDAASQAKNKLADAGRSAADTIDRNREMAADKLESAAATIHEKAHSLPVGDKVAGMAHTASHKLNATADYVRRNDVNGMMSDMERVVRNNPGPALLAAAVVGFLVGRAISND